jgi:hypothetical protein
MSPPLSLGNWLPTDFTGSQFPDDDGGDGSQNVGLSTVKLIAQEHFIQFNCCESFNYIL